METNFIAIVAVGVTLAGLILAGQRAIRAELADQRREFGERFTAIERQQTELRERMAHLETELRERMAHLETELRERMAHLETELRERMAHLEGLLEGLREAITIQRGAA